MVPRLALVLSVLVAAQVAASVSAQSPRQVKVVVEFRQSTSGSADAVQGGGSVIITDRSVRGRPRITAESQTSRVEQTNGIFTLVQDGGAATLTVATQVPYAQVAYYRDYAAGAGYVTTGVTFRDVGTSLSVRATILPDGQIRVRLTPAISYFASDRSGAIEFTEAATELIVPAGRPVVIGGATRELHEVTRRILGIAARGTATTTLVTLTAAIH